ncbi:MAG: DUF4249 domain-containing protein [Bacteroidales bacterium]|nr:MAG: DUF4249 domain-containing protein [Bacteroidales bacterium]
MTETLKNIIYFIIIILLTACQEVYNPGEIDAGLEIPVIEGYIDDGPGPYKVDLFWATAFNEKSNSPIKNARVTISDNFGNSAVFAETGNGRYLSNPGDITGIPGRIYTLSVELEDGSIYESKPVLMHSVEEIDTIYAEIGDKDFISKNSWGELMINNREGLYVYVDVNEGSGDKKFFRFHNRLVAQSFHYIYLPTYPDSLDSSLVIMEPTIVYCWRKSGLDEVVNIKSTFNSNSEQVIKRHELGFLPYYFSILWQDSVTTPKIPSGWIVTTTAYSLTEDAYEYYSSMIKQLGTEENIFDPIPSQIKGNIYCLSDTNQIVLGLFEVASKTTRHTAFQWSAGRDNYDIKNLSTYSAPPTSACQDTIMPDFWITFREIY